MPETSHDIRTLNSLIASIIDSIDGYTESAEEAQNSRFAAMFTESARERRGVLAQLQAEVARLGGNPEDDGTTAAAAHRVFINLKSAVTGRDDQAIVNEVERGEDHLKEKWEDAAADPDLTPSTRAVIAQCYESVRKGHDQARDLKHSLQAS